MYVYLCVNSVCCSVIDVVFVVYAQSQSAWSQILSFINEIVDRFTIAECAQRFSFVSCGNAANVEFRLNALNNNQETRQRIQSIRYIGGANYNLATCLDTVRNQVFQANAGARFAAPWVAVIITDRSPTVRQGETPSIAAQLRTAGIQIIPVGVTSGQLDRNFLNQIAFLQTRVTTVNSYGQLSSVAAQIGDYICNSHLSKSRDTFVNACASESVNYSQPK